MFLISPEDKNKRIFRKHAMREITYVIQWNTHIYEWVRSTFGGKTGMNNNHGSILTLIASESLRIQGYIIFL